MINYECKITAYIDQYDESPKEFCKSIQSEYPVTPKDLKLMIAKELPAEYTILGPLQILGEYHE